MKVTIQISVRVFVDVALAHFRINLFVRNDFNDFNDFYWIVDKIGISAEKGAAENVITLHRFLFQQQCAVPGFPPLCMSEILE